MLNQKWPTGFNAHVEREMERNHKKLSKRRRKKAANFSQTCLMRIEFKYENTVPTVTSENGSWRERDRLILIEGEDIIATGRKLPNYLIPVIAV